MADIFLSYTEKDRELARRVAALLESRGWTVWWDRRIPAGETWRNVLDHALGEMRCMLVLWSARSIESEWVYEEASEGRRQGKLFPVLLEAVRPPAGFREIQAADLSGWDGSPEFEGVRLLVADLEHFLGKPSGSKHDEAAVVAAVVPASLPQAAPSASLRTAQAWALAACLLLLAGGAYLTLRPSAPPSVASATQREPADPAGAARSTPPSSNARASAEVLAPRTPTLAASSSKPTPDRAATRRSPAGNARCADWLARIQLGESLSEETQAAFRKECRP